MYTLIFKVDPNVDSINVPVVRGIFKNDVFIPENGWVYENVRSENGFITLNLDSENYKDNPNMTDILKPGDTLRVECPEGVYHYIDDMISFDLIKNNQYISSNNLDTSANIITKALKDSDSIEVIFSGNSTGYLEFSEVSTKDNPERVIRRIVKTVDGVSRIDTELLGVDENNIVYIRWRDKLSSKYTQFIKAVTSDEDGEVFIENHIVEPDAIKFIVTNRATNGPIFDSGIILKARVGTKEITIVPNVLHTANKTELKVYGDELNKLLVYNEVVRFSVRSTASTIVSNRYDINFSTIASRAGVLNLVPAESSITENSMKLAFSRTDAVDHLTIDNIEIPDTGLVVRFSQIPISSGEIMNDTKLIVNVQDISGASQDLLAKACITYSYKEPGRLKFITKGSLDPTVPDLPSATLDYLDDGKLVLRPNHNLTLYTGQSVEYKHITAYKGHTAVFRSMVDVSDNDNEVILHDVTADVGPITDVKFRWTFAGRPFSALQTISIGTKYDDYIENVVKPKMPAFKPMYDTTLNSIFIPHDTVPLPTDIILTHTDKTTNSSLNTFRSVSQDPRNRSYTFAPNALNVTEHSYTNAANILVTFVYGSKSLEADVVE